MTESSPELAADPTEDRSFRNAMLVGLAAFPLAGAIALLFDVGTMVDVCWPATLAIVAAFAAPATVLAFRGAREMTRDEPARRGKLTATLCAVAFLVASAGGGAVASTAVPVVDCRFDKSKPRVVHARLVRSYRSGRTLHAEYVLTAPETEGTFFVKTEAPPQDMDVKLHAGTLGARWVDTPYLMR